MPSPRSGTAGQLRVVVRRQLGCVCAAFLPSCAGICTRSVRMNEKKSSIDSSHTTIVCSVLKSILDFSHDRCSTVAPSIYSTQRLANRLAPLRRKQGRLSDLKRLARYSNQPPKLAIATSATEKDSIKVAYTSRNEALSYWAHTSDPRTSSCQTRSLRHERLQSRR